MPNVGNYFTPNISALEAKMDVAADNIFPDDTHDDPEAYARTENDLEAAQAIVLAEAHVPSTVHGGQVAFDKQEDGAVEPAGHVEPSAQL